MTREEIALLIHWKWIIWTAGLVNVGAMFPQLYQILKARKTEGLNLQMFGIYLCIQVTFAIEGYFTRNTMLMWCLGLSAIVSLLIIAATIKVRQSTTGIKTVTISSIAFWSLLFQIVEDICQKQGEALSVHILEKNNEILLTYNGAFAGRLILLQDGIKYGRDQFISFGEIDQAYDLLRKEIASRVAILQEFAIPE